MNKYQKEWPFVDSASEVETMSFLKSLTEAKIFRTQDDVKSMTYEVGANLTYLYTLVLLGLVQESSQQAQSYLIRATSLGNFDYFRAGINDYYNLLYMFFGKTSYTTINPTTHLINRTGQNSMVATAVFRTLKKAGQGNIIFSEMLPLLLKLETLLDINNPLFKSARRELMAWATQTQADKEKFFRKSAKYIKALSARADILDILKTQVTNIGTLSNTQKVGLGLAAIAGGFTVGYAATRRKIK